MIYLLGAKLVDINFQRKLDNEECNLKCQITVKTVIFVARNGPWSWGPWSQSTVKNMVIFEPKLVVCGTPMIYLAPTYARLLLNISKIVIGQLFKIKSIFVAIVL